MTTDPTTLEAVVTSIGAQGDGVVEGPNGRLYVPFTVPGDRVSVQTDGSKVISAKRLADGPGRREPACCHFGICGGCALQHVAPRPYAEWKRERVVVALAHRGIETRIAPAVSIAPGSRRRVRFSVARTRDGVIVGFKERASGRVVGLRECPVALRQIVGFAAQLREFLNGFSLPVEEVSLTAVENGVDAALVGPGTLGLAELETLAAFANSVDLARLSWCAEPVVQRRRVGVAVGGVAIDLPVDAFVQPTAEGEEILRNRVLEILTGHEQVADLYAGWGAFAIALAAEGKRVVAAEIDEELTRALQTVARHEKLLSRLNIERRDLRRQPFSADDLRGFDAVVIDPPRAGAKTQAEALAESDVATVAYVSCDPASFARDARVLVDGGYRLEAVLPVDQFLWSHHVELVAEFKR